MADEWVESEGNVKKDTLEPECDGHDNLFYDPQIGITTHPQD
jgi:hypothetical protein